MKKDLEILIKDLEDRIQIQRDLRIQFDEMKDEATGEKIRILTSGYVHCLSAIRKILHNSK